MSNENTEHRPEQGSRCETDEKDVISPPGNSSFASQAQLEAIGAESRLPLSQSSRPSYSGTSGRHEDLLSPSSSPLHHKSTISPVTDRPSSLYAQTKQTRDETPNLPPIEFFPSAPGLPSIFTLRSHPTGRPTQEVVPVSSQSAEDANSFEIEPNERPLTEIPETPPTPQIEIVDEPEEAGADEPSSEENVWFRPTAQCPLPFVLRPIAPNPQNYPQASNTEQLAQEVPPSPSIIPSSEPSYLEDLDLAAVDTEESTQEVLSSPSVIPESEGSYMEDLDDLYNEGGGAPPEIIDASMDSDENMTLD